jgi:replicative DNA helicase
MNILASPLLGLSQRLPPSNLQAEQALLGALLANNKAYERVSEFLLPEHFADPIHDRIFQAIQRRVEAGQLADAVTLKAEFEHSGVLGEVGGTPYLAQLSTAMVAFVCREHLSLR